MRGVLVVGESLIDIVRRADGTSQEYAGGSAANVAVALARLGRPVRFASSWANDERGTVLARHLRQSGVGMAVDPHALERTSTAAATIAPDGSASYEFDLHWHLGELTDTDPVVVHTCSLGAVLEPGASEVAAILGRLRAHATVTYDVNARPAITGAGPALVERVERIAALSDLVKASDEDLEVLYPDLSIDSAAQRLLGMGVGAVVVTRGGSGATWFGHEFAAAAAAERVDVADTIGAGDTFGAAIIDALWERDLLGGRLPVLDQRTVTEVLEHAARAAAVTVSRPGADPPYRHELLP